MHIMEEYEKTIVVYLPDASSFFSDLPINVEWPISIKICEDKIEMITVKRTSKRTYETFNKTFAYSDLLLMNNTLNLIMRGKQTNG